MTFTLDPHTLDPHTLDPHTLDPHTLTAVTLGPLTLGPASSPVLSPADAADVFWAVANDDDPGDTPPSISFDRCLTWLESLRSATTDAALVALITDTIDDLHNLGPFGATMEDLVLGALASVEAAFEISAAAA